MFSTLLDPLKFALLVSLGLLLGFKLRNASLAKIRPVFFLLLNATLLATWFGGLWSGVFYCLLLGSFLFCLIRAARDRFLLWFATIAFLISFLALSKYDYPSWLPHTFTGGNLVRSMKGYLQIASLKTTIGISYFSFRLLHVLIDYRAGAIAQLKFLPFLNYIFFAPSIIAGPINRYQNFEEDLANPPSLSSEDFFQAVGRIILGLAKKILIAGFIWPYTLGNMEPAGPHAALLLVIACVCYSIYIYADFSGYTDIALGLGRIFGIRLPENFNYPFAATNVQDFWNRWHMSLTGWIKTYVFFPLNLWLTRSRPAGAKLLNPILCVMVSFMIIGMWHGQEINFLVFGMLHGGAISLNMLLRKVLPPPPKIIQGWARIWRQALTFGFVTASWIVFVYPLGDIRWLLRSAFP